MYQYRRCGWNGVSSARRLRQNSVMPRCYPLEPGFGSGRTAERQVWEVLRDQLPADAALLHSVTMIERATEYEADLVVGWPGVGVAVIEVKGGHISRDQGQSYQSSGGETHPVKDPVAQAQDPGDWTAVSARSAMDTWHQHRGSAGPIGQPARLFPAMTSARHLVLGLFLPAAPEVVYERRAVAASWTADISGRGSCRSGSRISPGSVRCQVPRGPWAHASRGPGLAGRRGGGPGRIALSWRCPWPRCWLAPRPVSSASMACMCARTGTCAGEPGVIRPRFAATRAWRSRARPW